MKIQGGVTGILTATVLSTTLAACGGSDSKVSVDQLQQTADTVIATPTSTCPLGLDMDKALKKAGVPGTATLGAEPGSDFPAVDGESATGAKDDAPLKARGGAVVTCTYALSGGGYAQVRLTGVHNGTAITLMAPLLQRDGELPLSDLQGFVTRKLETGKAVLSPGKGLVAVAKLDASGGDALLQVTSEAADRQAEHGPVVGEPLRALAEALGKQVRL